jgi:hypothetical protein
MLHWEDPYTFSLTEAGSMSDIWEINKIILIMTPDINFFRELLWQFICSVGFHDACHILEGDNIFWDPLLMFAVCESKLTCTIII